MYIKYSNLGIYSKTVLSCLVYYLYFRKTIQVRVSSCCSAYVLLCIFFYFLYIKKKQNLGVYIKYWKLGNTYRIIESGICMLYVGMTFGIMT